jgi:plastocyanin
MRRLLVACVILMLLPGVAWAGGGGVNTSACAGYGEGTVVSMQDSCFAGTAHFAPSGTAITISNDGGLPHTLTAVDGSFDTGQVAPGASKEVTIDEPGIYRVFCSLHGTPQGDGMAGVLVIGEAAAALLPASADPSAVPAAVALDSDERATLPVDAQESAASLVVLLVAGLAAGLALSALLIAMRIRIPDRESDRLHGLQPTMDPR